MGDGSGWRRPHLFRAVFGGGRWVGVGCVSTRNSGMPTTPTELCRAYAPIGIEADRGFEAVFADIDTALVRGELTPNQASALRCTIRHMITKGTRWRAGPGRAADFYHAVRSAVYGTSS